jgi:hypothetical protein
VRYIFLLLASLVSATALGQTDSNERSDSVVSELSNRSNIPETELRELLSDCSKNQMSTNILHVLLVCRRRPQAQCGPKKTGRGFRSIL